jgi:hypothetical protein
VIAHAFGKNFFARVSERRMTQIMRKSDGFRQVFIERQRTRDRATDRRNLD